MGVHATGTGTGWDEASPDVDQPHGKDYLELQDTRKGVRKRIAQEHTTFADDTVGGIHKPGGCAILGMEITDDCTAAVVQDGTYRGHGLIWSLSDTSNWGVLFCNTVDASAAGDWTVMRIHPDLQWAGGDVTWAGAHEFDASVDISGNVTIEGDLTIKGHLLIDSSADLSDVFVGGDITIAGKLVIDSSADFSDVYVEGDMSIDGTTMLQNTVLTGDSTFTFDAIAGETGPTFGILGSFCTKSTNTTYIATRTDGFVVCSAYLSGGQVRLVGTTPSETTVAKAEAKTNNEWCSITFPVRKGDTWDVTCGTGNTAQVTYWIPIGDNT